MILGWNFRFINFLLESCDSRRSHVYGDGMTWHPGEGERDIEK